MYAYKMRDKEPDGVTVAQVGLTCSRNNLKMFFLDDVNEKKNIQGRRCCQETPADCH